MAMKHAPIIEILDDGSQIVEGVIWIHPDRVSGAPCFAKTRVPVQNLFDYLESGARLEEFLNWRERVCLIPCREVKILLDHNLDRRLSGQLSSHEVHTALEMAWDTLKNGALLC
jgi:hypothetical protein